MTKRASISLPKNLDLPVVEDYRALIRLAYQAIETLGNEQWTDYNEHDPGITLLQALAHALTEIGYRSGFEVVDLLTQEQGFLHTEQAFFTARNILTNRPLTPKDYRKILVDLPNVANAWIDCMACACETTFYADCKSSSLFHAPQWRLQSRPALQEQRTAQTHEHPVFVKGLYDVRLQLDRDADFGDLNDNKLQQTVYLPLELSEQLAVLTIEARMPDLLQADPAILEAFTAEGTNIDAIELLSLSLDPTTGEAVEASDVPRAWQRPFFANLAILISTAPASSQKTLRLPSVPIRFFSSHKAVAALPDILDTITATVTEMGIGGLIARYQQKIKKTQAAIAEANTALQQARNLGEDFCTISRIATQDIAFCADVSVAADADIEYVLARIFHAIELYFNPAVPFYSLQELEAKGMATEAIFHGPPLQHGFILDSDLAAAELASSLKVSDLYSVLQDIPGVLAFSHMQFTRYDDMGRAIWPSHAWDIPLRPLHIPVLYQAASQVLFYKDGLPFVARMEEVRAILAQLRGQEVQGKLRIGELDYPLPKGSYRNFSHLEAVQHTLPLTYGVGRAGLADNVSPLRRAQAKQLKAYLLLFEQFLLDMNSQLRHFGDLLSLDETVTNSYFSHYIDPSLAETDISDISAIFQAAYTPEALQARREYRSEFLDRRNRMLDHLLARFGEQFTDYALLLNSSNQQAIGAEQLILDKIRFLKDYPRISGQRAGAIQYNDPSLIGDPSNRSANAERIARLLGLDLATTPILVVEHLLLRPLFPGAPLLSVCLEERCCLLGEEDPYSFRLTYLIKGGGSPFGQEVSLRAFADKTIRGEVPAHLLPKICWPGNAGVEKDLCHPIFSRLAILLDEEDCVEAEALYDLLDTVFQPWLAERALAIRGGAAWASDIEVLLADVDWLSIDAFAARTEEERAAIRELLVDHFTALAAAAYQFDRFEQAWQLWLQENAATDTKASLHNLEHRLQAWLQAGVEEGRPDFCDCAKLLLGYFGDRFQQWIAAIGAQEADWSDTERMEAALNEDVWRGFMEDMEAVLAQDPRFCGLRQGQFTPADLEQLRRMLVETYLGWISLSVRLQTLLIIFEQVRSAYPQASLHDCDDGNDDNPIRLDNNSLGSY